MKNPPISPIIFFDEEKSSEDFNAKEKVSCTIPGKPFAKQRPRASRRGRFTTVYTPKQTVDYENLVKYSYYQENGLKMLEGPLRCTITGTFNVPESASKKQKNLMLEGQIQHTKKPDCDNMAKIVLDALNDVAFHDDSQITELHIFKQYGETPNVTLTLEEL